VLLVIVDCVVLDWVTVVDGMHMRIFEPVASPSTSISQLSHACALSSYFKHCVSECAGDGWYWPVLHSVQLLSSVLAVTEK
jgi:hypothetical protein